MLFGTLTVGFTSLNARWDLALTTPQPPDACEHFCASHEKPWAVKCGWDGRWCSACDECGGGGRVELLSQLNPTVRVPPADACMTFCATHEKGWGEKCVWDDRECSACDETRRRAEEAALVEKETTHRDKAVSPRSGAAVFLAVPLTTSRAPASAATPARSTVGSPHWRADGLPHATIGPARQGPAREAGRRRQA